MENYTLNPNDDCEVNPAGTNHPDPTQYNLFGSSFPCSGSLLGCSECKNLSLTTLICTKCQNDSHVFDADLGICHDPNSTCLTTDGLYQRPNKACGLCDFYNGSRGKSKCKTCSFLGGCLTCHTGYTLNAERGTCDLPIMPVLPAIPTASFHGTTVKWFCPVGMYTDGSGECKVKHCLCTSDNDSYCTRCSNNFFAHDGGCVRACPDGFTGTASEPFICEADLAP
jgi:hypothetical protein